MSGAHAARTADAGETPPEGLRFDSEPGYVEARRDPVGPFVEVRWQQVRVKVRLAAWVRFVQENRAGTYAPEKLPDRPGWVRFEIDEGLSEKNAPSGWSPKVLEVPQVVWDRFVGAVTTTALEDVGLHWMGSPPPLPVLPPRASAPQSLDVSDGP
ncbi:hypothetical protein [Nonomuraea sp. NPDC049400]|uniref:hypothetical protein n=1 Tax=Nonomuraea sp. NPDC049400 TaxID=3364352 RepID=UPI00379B1965